MYNGIGLTTVRGSATSGYVQRNLGHVRPKQARERAQFGQRHRDNWENNKSARKANPEILDHQRKRRMEVKLMELRVAMEDRGYKEEEIEMKVTELRNKISAEQASQATENASRLARGSRDTHERAVHKDHENERFRRAFRVDEDHRPGDSFDPAVQARRREERKRKYEERELQRSEREMQRNEREMQHNERRKLQMEKKKKDDPQSLEDVTTQRHNREPKDALEKSGNASQESKQSELNIDVDDKDNVSGKQNTKRDSRRHRRNRQRGRSSSSDSSSSSSGSSSSGDSSSSSSGVSDTENKQRRGRSRRRESSNRGREKEERSRHRERHSGRGGRARRSADERDSKSVSEDKVNRRASRSTSREVNRRASRSPSREVNRRSSRSTSREVKRRASRSTSREGDRAGSSQHKKLRKTDDGNTSTKSLSCEDQQGRRQRKRSVSPHDPRRDDTHSSSKRSKRD